MKSFIPKSMFLTMSLLLGLVAQTQATPIIQVLSESLDVSYYVETESTSGTAIHTDSATGSLLGSGASVSYTEFYYSPSENENYVIDANGSGSTTGTNGFNLDAEADDYPFSGSGPFDALTSVNSVRGEASTSWVFKVLNEDVAAEFGLKPTVGFMKGCPLLSHPIFGALFKNEQSACQTLGAGGKEGVFSPAAASVCQAICVDNGGGGFHWLALGENGLYMDPGDGKLHNWASLGTTSYTPVGLWISLGN
ncbi:MAG: hypothetical protein DIZ78_05365 [endosymbiont of Escarpia spicata]|uniref:PEP-CTERM sorting domain-containing protein n=1 Tax=endosymbiont of Escarpia spicata TaxID=2200908 RepID=A0A370DSQ9_9GAMM|nr:MAG: hypothetical protein DIZ78_05365 [endosymbiont of Escarpia spicata]